MITNSMMNDTSIMIMCMVMMSFGLLLFVATIGITVYWVSRSLIRKSRVEDYPIMVLKERYANGEITEEEFKQRRTLLKEVK